MTWSPRNKSTDGRDTDDEDDDVHPPPSLLAEHRTKSPYGKITDDTRNTVLISKIYSQSIDFTAKGLDSI